ncbi:MAG TPA: hypothetical protein VG537_08115 [Candidatus Kapabacteria bacterium]|nr:hypothetical protein [Candidatus Kapabacteria bacterium]
MKSRPFVTIAFCFTIIGISYLASSVASNASAPFGSSVIAANLQAASPMMPAQPLQVPGRISHPAGPKVGIIQRGGVQKQSMQSEERPSLAQTEKSEPALRNKIIERRTNQMKRDGLSQKLELRRKCLRSEGKTERN